MDTLVVGPWAAWRAAQTQPCISGDCDDRTAAAPRFVVQGPVRAPCHSLWRCGCILVA